MPYVTEANLTDLAVERWSQIQDPRLRQVITAEFAAALAEVDAIAVPTTAVRPDASLDRAAK